MNSVMRIAIRTISSSSNITFRNNIHTSSMWEAKTRKLVKNMKEKKVPTLCPIMNFAEHKIIKKELGQDAPLDILVGHILGRDIKVQAVALKANISVFRESFTTNIQRTKLPKDLDPQIKLGKFNVRDDEIILENWSLLYKHTESKLGLKESDAVKEIFESTEKDKGMRHNIVGYYLSQGLPDIRLATIVFHRARVLLCARKGEFTTEEDKAILDFVEEQGMKWPALAKQLRRTSTRSVKDRYDVLTKNYQGGSYTLGDDKTIITEVFAVDRNGKNIPAEAWKKIGEKLKRNPQYVHMHWLLIVKPVLTRYQAGTLNVEVRKVLLDHLVENNMNYAQDVDWKELAKLPKFAGSTSTYLSNQLSYMKAATQAMSPKLSPVELTTGAIQSWYRNSERKGNTKKEEYREELIAVYKKIIHNE